MGNTAPAVLVVDDDESILGLVAMVLEHQGYTILRARNGREALAVWARQRTEIGLIITDVEMPAMSGIEFANSLLQSQPDVRILFISGSAEISTLRQET